jgi:type II secretory ATPase GspE/PulE/Tfp pilus assembly ATPase PilB-like protein
VKLNQRIAARLKVMAQLDIAEKRVPQDGRIKLNLSKTKQIDFRVSTLPTLFGEKVCCVSSMAARPSWASTSWATSRTSRSCSWTPSTSPTAWCW